MTPKNHSPAVTCISLIDYDHMEMLGDTLTLIAGEKGKRACACMRPLSLACHGLCARFVFAPGHDRLKAMWKEGAVAMAV